MANRIERTSKRDSDTLTPAGKPPLHRTTPNVVSKRRFEKNVNTKLDEVIAHLAGAYENERSRQVTEWERLRTH